MEIQYAGEQLYWGIFGNFLISLAFASALVSSISYYFSSKEKAVGNVSWKIMGRTTFFIHGISVVSIILLLLFLLFNHHFEYYYVWQHSNTEMSMKYILSCLWEGQEGSFLLWMFWHVVLGSILIFTSGKFESGVMFLFTLVQVFLVSMILGTVIESPILDYKLGTNPFTLLREHPDMMNMPFVQSADYLSKIDGRGLNPLLQNYWMTIHPPTLFLGFALTLVPFCFAVDALRRKEFTEWLQPALPWAFTGVLILGVGILMGGAWAYEALSFGGFWAWDPVENASLVPWLTLVAGAHLMLVYKNKGTSLFIAFGLVIWSFILVLWSTFLTRSGVLGNSSVHSFTDLGMTAQLLVYVVVFAWIPVLVFTQNKRFRYNYAIILPGLGILAMIYGFTDYVKIGLGLYLVLTIILLIVNYSKYFPKNTKEESLSSRELWMFVGALVITISWIAIIHETSKPALGKAFAGIPFLQDQYPADYAPPSDIIDKYNIIQAMLAMFIFMFMGIGQFLRYNKTDGPTFWKNIAVSMGVSILITIIVIVGFDLGSNLIPELRGKISIVKMYEKPIYLMLLFFTIFGFTANLDYLIRFVKGKWKLSGPSLAHIGFALVITGAVISAGFKKIISANSASPINLEYLNKDFKNNENIMLHKGDTMSMGGYDVVYSGDSSSGPNVYCIVDYSIPGKGKQFSLYPRIQMNPRMGNVAEPSTKHYFGKDVYTHITYIEPKRLLQIKSGKVEEKDPNETDQFKAASVYELTEGDTVFSTDCYIIFDDLASLGKIDTTLSADDQKIELVGKFRVRDLKGNEYLVQPGYTIVKNEVQTYSAFNEETGMKITVSNILPEKRKVEVQIAEIDRASKNDFIIMQAIIFPGINILWAGCFLMAIGTLIAILRRLLPQS